MSGLMHSFGAAMHDIFVAPPDLSAPGVLDNKIPAYVPAGAVVYADFVNHQYYNGAKNSTQSGILTAASTPVFTANGLEVTTTNNSVPFLTDAVLARIVQGCTMYFEWTFLALYAGQFGYVFQAMYPPLNNGIDWEIFSTGINVPTAEISTWSGSYTNLSGAVNAGAGVINKQAAAFSSPIHHAQNNSLNANTSAESFSSQQLKFGTLGCTSSNGVTVSSQLNAAIRKMIIYPTLKSDADLQALTV